MTIHKLVTVPEDIRAGVIRELERTLEEAKRGEISEILMIIVHPNNEWSERSSDTTSILSWIGRLETTKADWLAQMKVDRIEDPPE